MPTTTVRILLPGAAVHRRLRQPPSAPFGSVVPLQSEAAVAKAILAVFAAPPVPRSERSLTGLAREVRTEFALAQHMRSWGR